MNRSIAIIATAALGLGACATPRYVEAFQPEGQVSRIRLEVDQGTITLEAGEELWVERGIRAAQGTLDLSHEVVDGTLVLSAICTTPIPCAVDTVVTVPEGVPVEVVLGQGFVTAHGVANLDLELSEGEAELVVLGQLDARVGKGSLKANLADTVHASIVVGSGDIELSVPDRQWGLDLRGATVTSTGVEDVEGADQQVEATAPGGRITVTRVDRVATR